MDEYTLEAPINVIQAINRALIIHHPLILRRKKHRQHFLKHKAEGSEKLVDAAISSHDVLYKANTVFPFNLFPDTVTIDREKITIANRFFFSVAKITSVPIRDILSVEADVGPFFGAVHMSSRYFISNPYSVTYLRRHDALGLQRLLQGYIIAQEQKIDCSQMDRKELITLLEDLGKGDTD